MTDALTFKKRYVNIKSMLDKQNMDTNYEHLTTLFFIWQISTVIMSVTVKVWVNTVPIPTLESPEASIYKRQDQNNDFPLQSIIYHNYMLTVT